VVWLDKQPPADPPLVKATKDKIAESLGAGLPKMRDVARDLGLSLRSYHRRLAEHGASLQALAEDTRYEVTLELLADTSLPLAEIAFRTGFSEQSAFTGAFKRWTGQTPAMYGRGSGGVSLENAGRE
jgi:AraC-like DNA-binding protein